ncbi:MAG: hypothetical protein HC897_15405, partial [Thermoanaerobaculia bacterium]|nr:hypothetical protein [Thermoanaerobaculia bacterium]
IDLEVFGTTEHVAVAVSNLQIALDLLALGRREDLAEASALVEPSIRFLERTDPQSPRLAELLAVREKIALHGSVDIDAARR